MPGKYIDNICSICEKVFSPIDFHGLTPKMLVKEGQHVNVGDVVFFSFGAMFHSSRSRSNEIKNILVCCISSQHVSLISTL